MYIEMVVFFIAWILHLVISAHIAAVAGLGVGLTLLISGTVVLWLLAWHEYCKERIEEREIRRTKRLYKSLERRVIAMEEYIKEVTSNGK